MVAAGLELVTVKAKAEEPASEGVFFIVAYAWLAGCLGGVYCLCGNRQAKLYVGFELPCVEGAVEKPELNRSLGEVSVKVKAVMQSST